MINGTPWIDENTWIVSDTHFGHKNIVKYCNRPVNHNELMVVSWRDRVKRNDTVLHLGDLAVWYGEDEEKWLRKAASLSGKKYLIRGNHDNLKDKVYAELGFTVIPEFIQEFDGQRVLFSHYPDEDRIGQWDINIHGHIHNNPHESHLVKSNRRYRNVSMEVMDYKPVRLGTLL